MATNYATPGVYIEEIPKLPRSIAQVATAIPAFIGCTEFALDRNGEDLTNKPTRITSLIEYEMFFGGPQPEIDVKVAYAETQDAENNTIDETFAVEIGPNKSKHNMYYSLQAYFANEGGPCYIVSVAGYEPLAEEEEEEEEEEEDEEDEEEEEELTTAQKFSKGLEEIAKEDEPTLLVFPEGTSLLTEEEFYSLTEEALAQCGKLQDRFTIMDVFGQVSADATSGDVGDVAEEFRGGVTPTNPKNLEYGAAYFPFLKANLTYEYEAGDVTVTHTLKVGTAAAAPGPLNDKKLTDTITTGAGDDAVTTAFPTAVYNKIKKAVDSFPITLPPSPFIAGVYCSVDAARGVWKAPANVPLARVITPVYKIPDEVQGTLNIDPVSGKSINCIRTFTGRGTLVWGARTLAGNDNEWRYINVRRLFIMVEESCKRATEPFVFEPNVAGTWGKIQAMIENFLTTLWRQGALQGAKPEHAFYVSVGLGKTMSALDILEGRLIVEIGMAAVRPAEFIILRFMHKLAES